MKSMSIILCVYWSLLPGCTSDPSSSDQEIDYPTGSVTGTVTDRKTQQPVANATIVITMQHSGSVSTSTNANGSYAFSSIEWGSQDLVVTAHGYDTLDTFVNVDENTSNTKDILLDPNGRISGTVVIDSTGVPPGIAVVTILDGFHAGMQDITSDGAYAFSHLPFGVIRLAARSTPFVPETLTVSIGPDPIVRNFRLR